MSTTKLRNHIIPKMESSLNLVERLSAGFFGTYGIIIILGVMAAYLAGYIGVGYMTKPAWDADGKEGDEEITLKIDSKGIPAYNKLVLFRIFTVLVWIAISVTIINLATNIRKKRR